jgi:hypothetical protein
MPTPINRQSLNTDLVNRYNNQKVGGSFDAKNIVTSDDDLAPTYDDSLKGQLFSLTKGKFRTKQPVGLSDFSDVPDRINSNSNQLSTYIKGFSNKKYKE